VAPYRILFVCWGNICRSPTAEAILRRQVQEAGLARLIEVDSAGISDEHAGSTPDRRARAEAARRGLDLGDQRARRVRRDDWDRFDLLLVADAPVERILLRQAPSAGARRKVARITAFAPAERAAGGAALPDEVPDPYYGGADGFSRVFDLLEEACAGILDHARRQAGLTAAG
jgi:protein-tyrosine phosphatase